MVRTTQNERFGFALGLFATVAQVLLLRESLAVAGGNELVVAIGFTGWFIGIAFGAVLAGRMTPSRARLFAVAISGIAAMATAMVVIRAHRLLLDVPRGSDPSLPVVVVLLLVCCGIGGLVVGGLFTLGARVLGDHRGVGRLYVAEAVGALAGGLLFSLFMAEHLTHLTAFALVSAVAVGVLSTGGPRDRWRIVGLSVTGALVLGTALFGFSFLDGLLNRRVFASLRASTHIATEESAYGRLSIGKIGDQYELLVDGRFDYAFPDPWERPRIVHLALTQHPRPTSLLIVGGGPSDRVAAGLAHHLERLVLTHLDSRSFEMSRPFWSKATRDALADPRVRVVRDDGVRYIATTRDRFDVVLLLTKEPLSAGDNRYYTASFYQSVADILTPGGVLTTLTPGGANVLSETASRVSRAIQVSLQRVFREVAVVPGLELMFHATNAPDTITLDAETLARRFVERRVSSVGFSTARFGEIYDPARIQKVVRQLRRFPAELNTRAKPFVFRTYLQQWERTLGGTGSKSRLLEDVAHFATLLLILPFLGMAFGGLISRRCRRPEQLDGALGIASTGAAGMGLMWIILYVFQSAFGTLYTAIALLTGLFMAGLAAGAYLSRHRKAHTHLRDVHGVDGVLVAFLIVSAICLRASPSSPLVLYLWSFASGAVTGIAFPVMLRRASGRGDDERGVAALIEGTDHLGAALGAFFTGIILLPVFGVIAALLYFAGLKLVGMAGRWRIASPKC